MSPETIAHALGAGHRSGGWWRCRCPVHQSSGPTLALGDGPRGLIAHCHAGCSRDEVLAELNRLGLLDCIASAPPLDPAERERQREGRGAAAREADRGCALSLAEGNRRSRVVERYWAIRGLGDLPIPRTIRAARSWLRHPEGGSRPAMIALVEHVEFGRVAVYRTWLHTDGAAGKADFRSPSLSPSSVYSGSMPDLAAVRNALSEIDNALDTHADLIFKRGASRSSGLLSGSFGACTPMRAEAHRSLDKF